MENRKRVDDHRMDADVRLNNLTQQLSSFLSIDDDLSTSSPEQIVNLVRFQYLLLTLYFVCVYQK